MLLGGSPMRSPFALNWRRLVYWIIGGMVAASILVVALRRPSIECSIPTWRVVDGYCEAELTVRNRTKHSSNILLTIQAYRAKTVDKGARADYLAAERRIELQMLARETRIVRERLGVGEGDLRAVEVLSRKSQTDK